MICSALMSIFKLISSLKGEGYASISNKTNTSIIKNKITGGLIVIVCLTVFVSTGWMMTYSFPVEIFNKGASLLVIILFVWSCVQRKGKKITRFIHGKAFVGLTFLFCLNSGLLVAKTISMPQKQNIILLVIDCLRPDYRRERCL